MVGSAPIIRIYDRKMLKPNLGCAVAFAAYLEDKGSRFSRGYLKKPVLEFLAFSSNNRSDQCILPHGVFEEISLGVSALIISIM